MSMPDDADPLTVLHTDEPPIQPDGEFAARLRARLEAALTLPRGSEGVVMSDTAQTIAELAEPPVRETPRPAALPYLAVSNAREAIAWYVDAFEAVIVGDPIVMDDGRIGHAELAIAGGVLYLADEYPELGLKAPSPQANSVSLMLFVADTDAVVQRARERGAEVQRDIDENYGSRNATVIDPFGHRWMLSGPIRQRDNLIRRGDTGYVSVWTDDVDRAAAFYGHVLGWTYDALTHQVSNTTEHVGIFAAGEHPTLFCCYAVDDLDAAGQAIAAAGGLVGEVRQFDFGTVLDATDPLGAAFAVYRPTGDQGRPELNGAGPGELSYITYEVTDSAAFRKFYGRVLNWTFEPGRVDDGWGVQETHPMAGMAGGSERNTTVPMWTVSDIDAAVQRVREAGGTVIEAPAQQPYGQMAQCADDQGARFYLGEF